MSKTTEQLKELAALLDRGLLTRAGRARKGKYWVHRPRLISRRYRRKSNEFSGFKYGTGAVPKIYDRFRGFERGVETSMPSSIGAYRILDVVGEGGMGRVFAPVIVRRLGHAPGR